MKNIEKDFWILREGDLLPESTKEYKFIGKDFLDELKKDGLLFESIEEAKRVADILRNTVKSLRSEQIDLLN